MAFFSYNGSSSEFIFDYAVVNDTNPSSTPSSTGSGTPPSSSAPGTTTPPSPNHLSHRKVVAIGGALGGLVAAITIVLALFLVRKRNQPAISHNMPSTGLLPRGFDTYYEQTAAASPVSTPYAQQVTPAPFQTLSSSNAPMTLDSAPITAEAEDTVSALAVPTAENTTRTSHVLTELQMDSIQTLLKQNVPGPLVASVMESMRRGEGPSGGDSLRAGIVGISGTEAPPGYDFK